ncbi:MAG: NDP-sugar synthase [Acidobacteria bacterium]|nr:NDP-sugar synthase [Acidobacteriota bacterium]
MKAVILAGGKGTRLRPLTIYTPKPIVPVVNRPFLEYQIEVLRRAGVDDIVISLSYQPDKIEHFWGDGSGLGVRLSYITEASPLGTGGAYRFAADGCETTTVVVNGDILTDIDLSAVIRTHKERKAIATLTLTKVEDTSRYGLVETNVDGAILRFLEKPKPEEAAAIGVNTVNAGIYILEPEVLSLAPKGENRSFETQIMPEIIERGMPFFGHVIESTYWSDIGTPATYLAANLDLLNGNIRGFDLPKNTGSDVATAAVVDGLSRIAEDCNIKPGAEIRCSVLGRGVLVEEKAIVENSVIWPHTRIAAGAVIRDSVVGRSCHIGRKAIVTNGAILGDKTQLTDYTQV